MAVGRGVVHEEVLPTEYGIRVIQHPFHPGAKALAVDMPWEGRRYIMRLSPEHMTHLHDATGPGIEVARALPEGLET